MITNPQLPPKKGYIEVEENGIRVYKPTHDTLQEQNVELENKLLKAQLQAVTDRNDFMEECIAEMATQVYST